MVSKWLEARAVPADQQDKHPYGNKSRKNTINSLILLAIITALHEVE